MEKTEDYRGQTSTAMESAETTDMDVPSSSNTEIGSPGYVDEESGKDPIEKRLTLTFKNLTVKVESSDQALGETLLSRVDPREWGRQLLKRGYSPAHSKTILRNVSGQIKPGEMLLVLGRPGSGCTSLFYILANHRESFPDVSGETYYGSLSHKEAKKYRQQIVFNTEDDTHFPTLTVNQTMKFALRNKVPRDRPERLENKDEFVGSMRDSILESLSMDHTKKTLVGNEYIRGVSGGERKRVSLAETMAAKAPIQFWDQPTRGLDSRTALEVTRTLRRDATVNRKTIAVTTYQAGNDLYENFDKVLVLADGHVIYYGPCGAAKGYFEDLGFICPRGANVADFLTSVTVETERQIRPNHEHSTPKTAADLAQAYAGSSVAEEMERQMDDPSQLGDEVEDLRIAVDREKRSRKLILGSRSVYTAGLTEQIMACTKRQWQIILGDKLSLVIRIVSAIIQALVTGSLFYNLPMDSRSVFLRPGALFFPVLYFLLEGMSETTASFMGRPILSRHKRFGYYRPTAFCVANAITDIPVVIVQITCFSLILYFMCALQQEAGKFFILWLATIVNTLCFLQLFRAIGAMMSHFGTASLVSGLLSTVFFVYGGYLIPFGKMHPWFRWIFYLNPASYTFETLMVNEFSGLQLDCVAPQYIPYGEGYESMPTDNRGCTVVGSNAEGGINGIDYVSQQYDYAAGHLWRGIGVVIGLWIFFICLTSLGFELKSSNAQSSVRLFKRGLSTKKNTQPSTTTSSGNTKAETDAGSLSSQATHQSTFTWHDLDYFVRYQGADKQLLNKVFGYVQPGSLVALMGASGAGKTTLLDVLAQRKDAGVIKGSILIDGKSQGVSFQRTTGYCEQMDVHEATSTVREALVFSALLRQPREVSREEKIAYVDFIIDLLELTDICDALIGVPGAGLSIEQRKRVTLGVELVAKPTLLFLDEPTSGLDGQSAYNIVRFMRRLVSGGQAVLCTIHQPSAVLFNSFDSLLLLAKGGHMAYFGETGHESATILDYFARNNSPCPEGTNPAEHIVETIQNKSGTQIDWVDIWNQSPEREKELRKLHELNQEALSLSAQAEEDTASFATPLSTQLRIVLERQMIKLWRSPDYVWNKFNLHIFAALFSGFTFWMIGNGTFDLQLRLFAVFNFIFVAPGCINQMQPFFLHNRDIFETREKKSKTYHWSAFVGAQIISEIPYLVICATLYFGCWYFTCGFPVEASTSGHVYLQMIFYEFLYTSIGQAIAAYAPNEYFAAIMNPLLIGAGLVSFCGVVVPYEAMQPFWRYWIYWLDPFHYLFGGLLTPVIWDVAVECAAAELVSFDAPGNQTCGEYMSGFLASNPGYLVDPAATSGCEYCAYSRGSEYVRTFSINARYYGWRDTGITALFCLSSYTLVVIMMKLRSKKTKSARQE